MIRAKRTFAIGTIEAKENLTWNHYSIESRGVSLNHFNIGTTARRSQENFTTAMGTACRNQWNLSKQRNESALKNHSRHHGGTLIIRIPGDCINHTATVNCRNQGNQWNLYCSRGLFVFCMKGTGETKKYKKTGKNQGATGT